MVFLCIVRNCRNAKKSTAVSNYRVFRIPKDARCKEWLVSCQRQDLFEKPTDVLNKNYRVCNEHFKKNMFSSPEMTRLLPTAIPTEFVLIKEEEVFTVSSVRTSTGDQSFYNESIDTSTVTKQNQSTSMCDPFSSFDSLAESTSTQRTQLITWHTPIDIQRLNKKCEELEKKVETLSHEFAIKSMDIINFFNSVDHFYNMCDKYLPPNLSMVIKNYTHE